MYFNEEKNLPWSQIEVLYYLYIPKFWTSIQRSSWAFMPERSKGFDSSSNIFVCVGSNPTECTFCPMQVFIWHNSIFIPPIFVLWRWEHLSPSLCSLIGKSFCLTLLHIFCFVWLPGFCFSSGLSRTSGHFLSPLLCSLICEIQASNCLSLRVAVEI